jgi:uncharacterized peroxidase-related enzyme
MPRINPVDPNTATGKQKELLDGVKAKLGRVPNLMKTIATSPAVLEAYLNFSGSLADGLLDAKLREQIALTVAEANACEYCLSAHTAIGKMVGLDESEIVSGRRATSADARTNAALTFAYQIVVKRGQVDDTDVQAARTAGFSDGEITEIVANVTLNILTNYFNHVAQTVVDFSKIAVGTAA